MPSSVSAGPLKDEPEQQIKGIVVAGVAAGAVVIGAGAVELPVIGVLREQLDVLHRPIARLRDQAAVGGAAVGAAADRAGAVEQRVGGSAVVEPAHASGIAVAEVINAIQANGVQMMLGGAGQPGRDRAEQI